VLYSALPVSTQSTLKHFKLFVRVVIKQEDIVLVVPLVGMSTTETRDISDRSQETLCRRNELAVMMVALVRNEHVLPDSSSLNEIVTKKIRFITYTQALSLFVWFCLAQRVISCQSEFVIPKIQIHM
jgi:hypothetical protein